MLLLISLVSIPLKRFYVLGLQTVSYSAISNYKRMLNYKLIKRRRIMLYPNRLEVRIKSSVVTVQISLKSTVCVSVGSTL